MQRIDSETVQRILDAVDIVDVVSDFVSLKRRGANYIGLCPFHNDRSPSFSVSRSKGLCKCFSCGKGGSAVTFIMEHEHLSYNEALRYLAKKYNIEIKERELTDEERLAESERESLFAINDFALLQFENNLTETSEGLNVGLAYFRERGINDAMIKRYRLGYALEKRDALVGKSRAAGYRDENLIKTGLASRLDSGQLIDRFRGRVIYPVFTISGKVVAFGGRVLKTENKSVGKYVNSPESTIYSKSRELYGLYQAKPSIVKKDKCILVEGYMDVISMAQIGIENIVASSGTALTEGQIRVIRRFTDNVTVIYDSDTAGIKASLRGIDMLLAEGMNVSVLQLPDGEDPDSFAQTHSLTEVEEYIAGNETDFIKFKIRILLTGAENDPIKRAKVISDIVGSIAEIPDMIKRNTYIRECSFTLGVSESVLTHEVNKSMLSKREQRDRLRKAESARQNQNETGEVVEKTESEENSQRNVELEKILVSGSSTAAMLLPYEKNILRYIVKYGMLRLEDPKNNPDSPEDYKIIDFINDELAMDDIHFANTDMAEVYDEANRFNESFGKEFYIFNEENIKQRKEEWERGVAKIRDTADSLSAIKEAERKLTEECDTDFDDREENFRLNFIMRPMVNSDNDNIRGYATDLAADKYVLSKIHTKYAKVETEREQLYRLVPRAVFELKNAILQHTITELKEEIKKSAENPQRQMELLVRYSKMVELTKDFAKLIGDRVLTPYSK